MPTSKGTIPWKVCSFPQCSSPETTSAISNAAWATVRQWCWWGAWQDEQHSYEHDWTSGLAPVKGSCYADNSPRFPQGFQIYCPVLPPHDPKGAKCNTDEHEGSGEGFTAARGLRHHMLDHHQKQWQSHSPPFCKDPAVTCHLWTMTTTSIPRSKHLSGFTTTSRLEGYSSVV